ncbi:hypothetical protein GCM10023168_02370 [Fodinibacter luteus]|uniref:DUF5666 domain-containing protein n=1 Tax=Fodinibacter luteus TaxID=552064 RepID=A0ABP8JX20_9MICO
MTDQTPPEPGPPAQPPAARPDQTAALPPQYPAGTAPGWAAPPGGPAAPPPAAGWPPGTVPAGSAAAPAPPSGPGRWWSEATSSSGGRAALIVAAVLAALLLVTGVGLVAALATGYDDDRWDDERVSMSDGRGRSGAPGQGEGKGNNGRGLGQGDGRQGGNAVPGPNQGNPGLGNGNGNGKGQGMGRAAGGLDVVLHGEFTTNVTGTPTVMVVQTGRVTAYTAGSSLTVESTDGFEATYTLDGTEATGRGAEELATGGQVRVVAAKEGMKVTRLDVD